MVKLTWFSHSCFQIETKRSVIIIDPYLTDNPKTQVKPSEIRCDAILVSHAHFDHVGDAVEISKNNQADIIGVYETVEWCKKQGAQGQGMNIGGSHQFDFGEVTLTPALHSSGAPDGSYGGTPCGFVIRIQGKTIYFAGDTALSYDMKLLGEQHNINVALLPIGDYYTMGPVDAATAVEFLKPKLVIPMHYNTFPTIEQDPEDFVDKVGDLANVRVMNFGETIEL